MAEEKIFITNSFEATQKIGMKFAERLHLDQGATFAEGKNALVIALYGDLGSGKTTFVQGLAKGLGIKKRIISPTFIVVRTYDTNIVYSSSDPELVEGASRSISSRQARTVIFYHIDLYRTDSEDDIKGLGINEIFNDQNSIVAIEWAEKMGDLLPQNRIDIQFAYMSESKRKISISRLSSRIYFRIL